MGNSGPRDLVQNKRKALGWECEFRWGMRKADLVKRREGFKVAIGWKGLPTAAEKGAT